jgi:hypothetical protein
MCAGVVKKLILIGFCPLGERAMRIRERELNKESQVDLVRLL